MKKRDVYVFPVGSPEFILAHARYKESRGKRPSMSYNRERNPEKALEMATVDAVKNLENEVGEVVELINFANDLNPKNVGVNTSFDVEIGLEKHFYHDTFVEAYKCFYSEIMAVMKQGTSHQWLETSNYIKHTVKTLHGPVDCVLNFFQAKDLAYIVDVLKDGKLQEPSHCTPPIRVDLFFLETEAKNREGLHRDIEEMKQRIKESEQQQAGATA